MNAYAPPDAPPPPGICVCSLCRRQTYVDAYGVKRPGHPQSSKMIKRHTLNDKLQAQRKAIQATVLENTVLMATAGVVPVTAPVETDITDEVSADEVNPERLEDDNSEHDEVHRPTSPDAVKARQEVLSALQSGFDHRLFLIPKDASLVFTVKPESLSDPPASVDVSDGSSRHFLQFYDWLLSTRQYLASLEDTGDRDVDTRLAALLCKVDNQVVDLTELKARSWEAKKLDAGLYGLEEHKENGPVVYDPARFYRSRAKMEPFVLAALVMTTILHSVHSVTRADSHYILTTIRVILFGVFVFCNGGRRLTSAQDLALQAVPKDVRTALKRLHIDPEIVRYACCPRCFSTYPPDLSAPDDPYPHHCTFSETDREECGRQLVVRTELAPARKGDPPRIVYRPLKPYPYRPLASWLAALFSRPAIEELLMKSWTRTGSSKTHWTDIFDAPMIRQFLGPDGQLFSVQPPGSSHLVFSLFIDWFNPHGNKAAGKSHSIGAIYLVCLNLPPHLRFRPENVYLVAIIPGPKEPSLHQLNHLLRPLVDDLERFWTHGLYLKRTALRFIGLFLRVAVVPLVCDLPALRKAAGFAGHSSKHVCSFCRLRKQHLNNITRPWPVRTAEEHRRVADLWLRAPTQADRNAIFEEYGVRWSELLRLPYWDPIRFSVVDAMHCLFLGNLRHHCRDVWGIDVKDQAGPQNVPPHTPEEQRQSLTRVVAALEKKSRSALSGIRKGYLAAVAQVNGIAPESRFTKKDYICALLDWTNSHAVDTLELPPVLEEHTANFHVAEGLYDISKFRIMTQEVIDVIRADIENTILPSWLERPPKNFGSAAHGKLKADQWRTVCTVNLTITLVRLWGVVGTSRRNRLLLDNFVHLVTAVNLATRRSMTKERAMAFDHHMFQYLQGLRDIFSHDLVPNHHLSLHIVTCLLLFGPVHGWWAYPFERYNGLLQNLNTNNLPDDMPLIFMRGFYTGAELRWLMESTTWPEDASYQDMLSAYGAAFSDTTRGTRVSDLASMDPEKVMPDDAQAAYNAAKQVTLEDTIYEQILRCMPPGFASFYADYSDSRPRIAPYAQRARSTQKGGLTYATREHGRKNSYVFVSVSDSTQLRPGQIVDILLHRRLEEGKPVIAVFLVVDIFTELIGPDITHDPFRLYPELNARLCYNRSSCQIVVRLDDVAAHFAALSYTPPGIGEDCIVCLSLDRS